jgi:P-type Ca2+ transporter type 2C
MSATEWYAQTCEAALAALGTSPDDGLTAAEAAKRLGHDGPNELTQESGKSPWKILAEQFANLLVALLIVAAVVSFALGDAKDAIAILVIVILNGLLGFRQEYSAEKAMAALRKLSVPKVRVRRDGEVCEIDARELVAGDIVLLEAGNMVPADGRLVECASLRVQESALTGESESVEKTVDTLQGGELATGDRRNMVFMGTVVTYGRAEAVITTTGMLTELGRVAELLQTTEDEETPLARKLNRLGHVLVGVALGLIAVVAVIGLARGEDLRTVFLTAVSMAVAAVPEGLPAVVTVALALGAKRMLARKALIRKLPAVETLGSVTAICTDKTGTLTQNRMTVTALSMPGGDVAVPASMGQDVELPDSIAEAATLCLGAAALCCDAVLKDEDAPSAAIEAIGDPTENALVVAAHRIGLRKAALEESMPRVAEAPFDSDRKRMSTVHEIGSRSTDIAGFLAAVAHVAGEGDRPAPVVAFAKGAVDSLLEVSTRVYADGGIQPLDDEHRARLASRMEAMAGDGIRVLGVACRPMSSAAAGMPAADIEQDLILLGLVGMMDPLRDEVKGAVKTCQEAGIRPVMITGDHPLMARHIGRELGIVEDGDVVIGADISAMDDAALEQAVGAASVYARVSPEHKLRIVDALQARGEITSMTGDGVNDAPALKSADIGVAMGITGTDVAKEASDMVLLDDKYTTIVAAVREGRVIFDNILRFMRFILSSNAGELLVMLVAPFLGMPIPLLPVQILWMNLVTDGFPALALGVEPPERDVMQRSPRDPQAPIIDWKMGRQIIWIGALMAILSLGVGYTAWVQEPASAEAAVVAETAHGGHHEVAATTWQTMLFTAMVFTQLFLSLGVRSTRDSLLRIGLFSNRPMVAALALTFVLQIAVIYVPVLQTFFRTTALSAGQFAVCVAAGAAMLAAVEASKLVGRLRGRQ